MIELNEKIICFNCVHYSICYYRLTLDKKIIFDGAPLRETDVLISGSYQRLYVALAGACERFKKGENL